MEPSGTQPLPRWGLRSKLLVLFLLAGCATPGEREVAVSVRPTLQAAAIAHRWQARDVHHYELTLSGGGTVSRVSLAPTSPQARFLHLRQGVKYRIEARAWGNPGGTAPTTCLNQEHPSVAEADLTGGQDLPSEIPCSLSITFDPVPFSGSAQVLPQNLPGWAKNLELSLLDDTGRSRFQGSFLPGPVRLVSLQAGIHYQIQLTARGKSRIQTASHSLFFDQFGQDLEQDATVSIAF